MAVSVQADAALAAIPGGKLVQYIAPRTADGAAIFRVNQGEASPMVAVDPYTGTVLGNWERRNGLYDLADTIHGTLLIGDIGDRLIDVAAGFGESKLSASSRTVMPSFVSSARWLLEQNDEWAVQRSRYMSLETIAAMSDDPLISLPRCGKLTDSRLRQESTAIAEATPRPETSSCRHAAA